MGQKSIVVLKAMTAAYVVTILLLLILSFVMYKLHLADTYVVVIINFVYVLANFTGGLICAKAMNSRRIVWGVITAAAYFVILYLISLIVGGTELKNLIEVGQMAAYCLIGGIIGGILS